MLDDLAFACFIHDGRYGCLHDHLLAREEPVGDEFAGSDGDLGVSHDCDDVT